MTVHPDRRSAEIYAFPPRGRFASSGQREEERPASNPASPVCVASASGWYHEEAIREAERARKN